MTRTYEGFGFLKKLPVNWITLSIDGDELLVAVLSEDDDRVLQATWSANTFLARVLSSYLRHSFLAEDMITLMESGASFKKIKSRYKSHIEFVRPFSSPGYLRIRKDLGLD